MGKMNNVQDVQGFKEDLASLNKELKSVNKIRYLSRKFGPEILAIIK